VVRWQLQEISFSDIAMIMSARTYLLSYFWLGVWSVLYNEFLYVWSLVCRCFCELAHQIGFSDEATSVVAPIYLLTHLLSAMCEICVSVLCV